MTKNEYHSFFAVSGSHSRPKSFNNDRTSLSHPLQINSVQPSPTSGHIEITFCPGKVDRHSAGGGWNRDLTVDVEAIRAWGASVIVTLLEQDEFDLLQVRGLPDACRTA